MIKLRRGHQKATQVLAGDVAFDLEQSCTNVHRTNLDRRTLAGRNSFNLAAPIFERFDQRPNRTFPHSLNTIKNVVTASDAQHRGQKANRGAAVANVKLGR